MTTENVNGAALICPRYSNAAIASKTLQELSESATRALASWEQNLPNSLRLDTTTCEPVPPQVLVLQ